MQKVHKICSSFPSFVNMVWGEKQFEKTQIQKNTFAFSKIDSKPKLLFFKNTKFY
jgi:hypothetical protein